MIHVNALRKFVNVPIFVQERGQRQVHVLKLGYLDETVKFLPAGMSVYVVVEIVHWLV